MNTIRLNTIGTPCKAGSNSGGGGDTPSRPKWTGHADAEGLRAIGWTDEDIAYYQENGVNWNAEDDEYHKVTDDNKALYGVLTADNISTYKDRIVYLPKIDTSAKTSMTDMFQYCYSLVSIPKLDTQNVTDMKRMFDSCRSLVTIPQLDTAKVIYMGSMFNSCHSLVSIPQLDTQNVMSASSMFMHCSSLKEVPDFVFPKLSSDGISSMFSNCSSLKRAPSIEVKDKFYSSNLFRYCYSLEVVPPIIGMVYSPGYAFGECYSLKAILGYNAPESYDIAADEFSSCRSLTTLLLNNLRTSLVLSSCALISKESLLYIINNEKTTKTITITLHSYAYSRLAEDADIVAALNNHPNISLASA